MSKELHAFNRTSMELKHACERCLYQGYEAFNRTSMELKHHFSEEAVPAGFLLIEPVWN